MKYLTACLIVVLLLPAAAGWSITPKEFDELAIPMMAHPEKADALLKVCDQTLKEKGLDPEFEAFVHIMRSHALLLKKRYADAAREADIVIRSGRQGDLGYCAMRDVLFARGKYDEGLEVCLRGASTLSDERSRAASVAECQGNFWQATMVSAKDLHQAYARDAKKADARYRTHTLPVQGKLLRIEGEASAPVFVLGTDNRQWDVICLPGAKATGGGKAPAGADPESAELSYRLEDAPAAAGRKSDAAGTQSPVREAAGGGETALPEPGMDIVVLGTVSGLEGKRIVLTKCALLTE
jgi:nucleotide-binding universal stress UspA family protein